MRADLHIHTTASDGTWTPGELVEASLKLGLAVIAVTDHDSMKNVLETEKIAKAAGLKFLRGVELSSTKEGLMFHILGYGIDVKNKKLEALAAYNDGLLREKDYDSIRLLEAEGWPVSLKEFQSYTYDRRRGGWSALAYLEDKGLCTGVDDFFKRIFTAEHELAFPEFKSVREVIDTIHGAGGFALCAHAASHFHGPGLEEVLDMLKGEGLDGFECFHSCHDEAGTKMLLSYCKKHRLMISGGSDNHGTFVPGRPLGVPEIDTKDLYLPGLLQEAYCL